MTTKDPIKFDSADYLEQLCDLLMKKTPRWFDSLDTVCSHVFQYDGQTCSVIGYPRKRGTKLYVPVSDMDAGRTFLLPLKEVKSLLKATKGRKTEEQDYRWSHIDNSMYEVEAEDISIVLANLREQN